MDFVKIDEQVLGLVFNRLRKQEKIGEGKTTSAMSNSLIFKILFNARYKLENEITLTDLEQTVRKEVGNNIKTFVAQKYEKVKVERRFNTVPYKELEHKTVKDFERVSRRRMFKIVLCDKIA